MKWLCVALLLASAATAQTIPNPGPGHAPYLTGGTAPVCGDGDVTFPEQCDPGTGVQAPCAYGDSDGCIVCSGQNSGAEADVTLYTTVPTSGKWNMAGVEIMASGTNVVAIDTNGNNFPATATSVPSVAGAATVTGFSTATADDLIVAFTSFDSTGGAQNVTVTGGGLTWTRVARSYLVAGEAAIWTATASGTLSSVSITATPSQTKRGFLKVVAFRNTSGIGATAIANAATGAATIVVPGALSGSWSWAVGMDWDNSGLMCTATNPDTYRCYPDGQISQDEIGVSGAGTFWVQSQSAPSPFGAACQNVAGITSYCGDTIIDTGNSEQCDDGNTTSGDGCSSTCQIVALVVCNDTIDNDRDGATDYPADTGCSSAGDTNEHGTAVCDDGSDNDGDGLFDYQIGGVGDPGCISIADTGERGASTGVPTQCDDDVDNDGVNGKDYPTDPNCSSAYDTTEEAPVGGGTAQCEDGIDNDGDGLIDLFAPSGNEALGDTGCATLDDDSESVGIPAGTVLTSYSGPYTITANGTVIDSKDITQQITIAANNVTIRKSRIRPSSGSVDQPAVKTPINATNTGNVIEDSLIDGNNSAYCIFHNDGNSSQTSLTLERVEIKGCVDMFGMGRSTVISNNYWHGNWNPPNAHGDALEANGGIHQWAHHNVVIGNYSTAAIAHGDFYSPVTDILIEKNYIGGAPARLFLLGSGNYTGVDYWRVAYNRLKCTIGWYDNPAPAGILPEIYPTGNRAINDHLTWTGNTCAADGSLYDAPLTNFPAAGWVKACANGYDDDRDGLTDMADSGCSSSSDNLE